MLYKLTYHVHLCILVTVLPSEKHIDIITSISTFKLRKILCFGVDVNELGSSLYTCLQHDPLIGLVLRTDR